MEEGGVLSGDNAFNAHFGECIAAIGDIDDDGYQGQHSRHCTHLIKTFFYKKLSSCKE